MITGHVFIATSLDGFIARLGGEIDWLEGWPEVGHDYGFHEFMDTVDGLIMGRGTYEKAATFETWPYAKPVVVMSSTLDESDLPAGLADKVRVSRSEPRQLMKELDAEGWKRAYVDGGQVIQSFLREGLIADMVLTHIPILIGNGLPLFGPLPADTKLTHLSTVPHASGFVQSRYAVGAS
jgi:dihydrofolate reductase